MSEEYWKGYGDFRIGKFDLSGYLQGSKEKDDYVQGHSDSEYDKDNGHDAR